MKPKELGSVNACHLAYIYDANGKQIATCYSTPNAFAYAFKKLPNATVARWYIPHWPDEIVKRSDIASDRLLNGGWMKTDKQAGFNLY